MALLQFGLLLAVVTIVHASSSPCPEVFQYNTDKKTPNQWDGTLNFDSEFGLSGMYIRVILDKKADNFGHEGPGEIKTEDHISWLIKMPNSTLTPGTPVKIPFWVKFNEKDGEPKLASVRLNAREVCPEKKEAVNISPCPGVFKQTFSEKPVEGKWYGELNLDSEFPLHGVWIRVFLDKQGKVLPNGFGEVEPRDHNSFLIRNKDHVLNPGNTLTVPFIVSYDDPKLIPNISQVKLNARTVCESKLIPTTVQLTAAHIEEHTTSSTAHIRDHTITPEYVKAKELAKENVHNHNHHH